MRIGNVDQLACFVSFCRSLVSCSPLCLRMRTCQRRCTHCREGWPPASSNPRPCSGPWGRSHRNPAPPHRLLHTNNHTPPTKINGNICEKKTFCLNDLKNTETWRRENYNIDIYCTALHLCSFSMKFLLSPTMCVYFFFGMSIKSVTQVIVKLRSMLLLSEHICICVSSPLLSGLCFTCLCNKDYSKSFTPEGSENTLVWKKDISKHEGHHPHLCN